jgi:glycosyltransferase involved in cell wall biosynthesis
MEDNLPLVSVAVITYNQKDFLYECIESILTQDYPNIEIVIADDASTDGTQAMLHEYNIKYPGKFVLKLSESNQGITKNCNLAHFACSGKYVAWMGGDDLMLPGKLSTQVTFMENNFDCTICYHDLDVFDSDTNNTLYIQSHKVRAREGSASCLIKYGTFNGACSTMVRAEKAPIYGFNITILVASDWLYYVESLVNGGEIKYINKVLGRYRRHENNITNKKTGIGQNTIDHFNSCNYIFSKYPRFFSESMYRYASVLVSARKELPYFTVLYTSLKLRFNFKVLMVLVIYMFTLGKIRL